MCISYFSLIVSICSLFVSGFVAYRDRRTFLVHVSYNESWEHMLDDLNFRIVNVGRRPITLDRIEFISDDGNMKSFKINKSIGMPMKSLFEHSDYSHPVLNESQFFEFTINRKLDFFSDFQLNILKNIYVFDSTGKKITAKCCIDKIRENWKYFL